MSKPMDIELYNKIYDTVEPFFDKSEEKYDTLMVSFICILTDVMMTKMKDYDLGVFAIELNRVLGTVNDTAIITFAEKYPQYVTDMKKHIEARTAFAAEPDHRTLQ